MFVGWQAIGLLPTNNIYIYRYLWTEEGERAGLRHAALSPHCPQIVVKEVIRGRSTPKGSPPSNNYFYNTLV